MCQSLGKKDFSKIGLLAIIHYEEMVTQNKGIIEASFLKDALVKAMSSDLLKLSRKEIEDMATEVKGKYCNWGSYASYSSGHLKTGDIFKTRFYKHRISGEIISDLELIDSVEKNNNLSSFYYIGKGHTKEDMADKGKFTPSDICTLDIGHIKYLAGYTVS